MTIKKIINILQGMGYKVSARKRKDGGYLITSLNDMSFKGAKGNIEARKLLGVELSEKKRKQLVRITRPRLAPIPKEVQNQMQRINRKLRRMGSRYGRVTTKQYRENVKLYGEEEAKRKLNNLERYHKGLANITNIMWLIQRINTDKSLWPTPIWDNIINLVQARGLNMLDKQLMQIYEILYDTENALSRLAQPSLYDINREVGAAYQHIKAVFNDTTN